MINFEWIFDHKTVYKTKNSVIPDVKRIENDSVA